MRAAALPLVALLAACRTPESVAPPTGPAATEAGRETPSKIPLRGLVSMTAGVTSFHECGAPASSIVTVTDDGEIAKAFATLGAKPSDAIYVELGGALSADGKTLAATELLRARGNEGLRACDAAVFEGEFVANGNEPFWAVEVGGNGIVYRDPALPKGRKYPYAFTRTETGSVVYATKLEHPAVSTLEIAVEPARCVDSMSGEVRGLAAHVTLDGRKLEGCAVLGVPRGEFGNAPLDELNRFAGADPHTVHLWKEPVIDKRLHALLGAEAAAFHENMQVESPLMKDDGIFYVTGNRRHQGGMDSAIFLADPASDTLSVILFVNGVRHDLQEGGREIALPADVVTMIGNMAKR
jgi:putative lipoprotein